MDISNNTNSNVTSSTSSAKTASADLLLIDEFNDIDAVGSERSGSDTVNFSSKAQFLLDLQTYAISLPTEDERQALWAAVTKRDSDLIDDVMLDRILNMHAYVADIELPTDTSTKQRIFGAAPTEPLIVRTSETASYKRTSSSSPTEHYTDLASIDAMFEQLKSQAFNELDKQDANAVTDTLYAAINQSKVTISSTSSLFQVNYDFERADYLLENMEISSNLKTDFRSLLGQAQNAQNDMMQGYLDDLNKKLIDYPNVASSIRDSINIAEEAISLNSDFQTYLDNGNAVLESKSYFKDLIWGSLHLNNLTSSDVGDMFDHYEQQHSEYTRIFIERDWIVEHEPHKNSDILDSQFERAYDLSDRYIQVINDYMTVSRMGARLHSPST